MKKKMIVGAIITLAILAGVFIALFVTTPGCQSFWKYNFTKGNECMSIGMISYNSCVYGGGTEEASEEEVGDYLGKSTYELNHHATRWEKKGYSSSYEASIYRLNNSDDFLTLIVKNHKGKFVKVEFGNCVEPDYKKGNLKHVAEVYNLSENKFETGQVIFNYNEDNLIERKLTIEEIGVLYDLFITGCQYYESQGSISDEALWFTLYLKNGEKINFEIDYIDEGIIWCSNAEFVLTPEQMKVLKETFSVDDIEPVYETVTGVTTYLTGIDDYSNTWNNATHEYEFREYRNYTDKKAEASKKGSFEKENFEAQYEYTMEDMYTNYATHVYSDVNNDRVTYQYKADSDELVAYLNMDGLEVDNSKIIASQNELLAISDGLSDGMSESSDYMTEIYSHVIAEEEEGRSSRTEEGFYKAKDNEEVSYVVSYYYMVNGIKTLEKQEYTIKEDGSLTGYHNTLPGEFSEDGKPEIDVEKVEEKMMEEIDGSITDGYEILSKVKKDEYLTVDESGDYLLLSFWEVVYDVEGKQYTEMVSVVGKLQTE